MLAWFIATGFGNLLGVVMMVTLIGVVLFRLAVPGPWIGPTGWSIAILVGWALLIALIFYYGRMSAWFLETGFGYVLIVAAIALIGLLLVYRGIWGDRSKGRVRCPKCWYDMRGTVPRLECPECGHDAGQERRLHNTRRRWGRMAIGVALVLLSAYPLVIVGGWWREQAVLRKYFANTGSPKRISPAWLVERLPDELARFFERVVAMSVDDSAQFAACRRLRYLRTLHISGRQWRYRSLDADLVHLKGLSKLWVLILPDTRVTDAGLMHLKGLSELRWLDLRHTQVTDADLVHLQGLSNLTYLDLYGTRVTDAGMAELKQAIPNLKIKRRGGYYPVGYFPKRLPSPW